jgi:molecular chaperone DnaJ
MRDYYEILGVSRDADTEAIKKAYRRLALQYHPDRNNGDRTAEDRFKELTEAYEVLRDPDKRGAYDRFGHAGVKGRTGGYAGFDFADALEIFMRDVGGFGVEDLFGGGGARRRRASRAAGPDMRVRLPLSLAEVATGVRKKLKLRVQDPCGSCSGSGAAPGSAPRGCGTCGGAGEVRRVQRSFLGQLVSVTPCPTCGGDGQVIDSPCDACRGRGVASAEHTVEVEVPAGVSTGDYLTLRGQGNAGPRGGGRGDVLVVLEVEEDERFQREGSDLIYDLGITFSQAALGADVEIPALSGSVRVRIAPGTQSGQILRLRGRGLPQLQGGGRGDLLVRVTVWTPTSLTPEQEKLFRELAVTEAEAPSGGRRDERGFWSKVKEAFGA